MLPPVGHLFSPGHPLSHTCLLWSQTSSTSCAIPAPGRRPYFALTRMWGLVEETLRTSCPPRPPRPACARALDLPSGHWVEQPLGGLSPRLRSPQLRAPDPSGPAPGSTVSRVFLGFFSRRFLPLSWLVPPASKHAVFSPVLEHSGPRCLLRC